MAEEEPQATPSPFPEVPGQVSDAVSNRRDSVAGAQPIESNEQHSKSDDYGLLDPSEYRGRLSPELAENNDFDLTENDLPIVRKYLANQEPAYLAELSALTLPQHMNKAVETVITIPSYQEGRILANTLRRYASLADRSRFEVTILENHPEDVERDDSATIIRGVKKEFPDLNVVHLYKVFKRKPAIGQVRKYLVDAVLLRKAESGIDRSLAIVSNDADLEDIRQDYALRISTALRTRKRLDAVEGKWDYPAQTFRQYPLLHATHRLWRYINTAFRQYGLKTQELTGTNSAFRSGIYAAVGGYNQKAQLAEDWELSQMIKAARGNNQSIGRLDSAWLISNPRRAVVKMLSGSRFIRQHDDFHVNEDVRQASTEELLLQKREFDGEEFRREVQAIYEHCAVFKKSKGGSIDDGPIDKSFDRAMRFLGVQHEIADDKVAILDTTRLMKGLRKHELQN